MIDPDEFVKQAEAAGVPAVAARAMTAPAADPAVAASQDYEDLVRDLARAVGFDPAEFRRLYGTLHLLEEVRRLRRIAHSVTGGGK